MRNQARRHNWLSAGRRWRKTTLLMSIAVEEAAAGRVILWGGPVYDQVRICWNEAKRAAIDVATFRENSMTATFPGGGHVLFRSLDNADSARGHTADGIVIDEAGDVPEPAWYEVLRPMPLDTGGWSWCIGTPKGMNWFWRECMAANERPDSRFWNAPTLGVKIAGGRLHREPHPLENPFIPFSEMEQYYRTVPERVFRQEGLGEFMEEAGGVFRGVTAAIDAGRNQNEAPKPGRSYALGVDLARVQDYTVITVMDSLRRQVYHERFNGLSWERQTARIADVSRRYHSAPVWLDSTGVGDPPFESLRKMAVPVHGYVFTNSSKEKLIDDLAIAIEGGNVRLMDIPEQTTELLAYQYELTPSRNVRMNAPEGMHDDCVIALALASYATEAPKAGLPKAGGKRATVEQYEAVQRYVGHPSGPIGG